MNNIKEMIINGGTVVVGDDKWFTTGWLLAAQLSRMLVLSFERCCYASLEAYHTSTGNRTMMLEWRMQEVLKEQKIDPFDGLISKIHLSFFPFHFRFRTRIGTWWCMLGKKYNPLTKVRIQILFNNRGIYYTIDLNLIGGCKDGIFDTESGVFLASQPIASLHT
jgi:hypothetical protein